MRQNYENLFSEIGSVCFYWLNYRSQIGFNSRIPESYLSIPISEYLTNVSREKNFLIDFEHGYTISGNLVLIDLLIKDLDDTKSVNTNLYSEFKLLRADRSFRYLPEKGRILNDVLRLAQISNNASGGEQNKCFFIMFGRTDEFIDFAFYSSDANRSMLYRRAEKFSGQFNFLLSLDVRNPERNVDLDTLGTSNMGLSESEVNSLNFGELKSKLLFIRSIDSTIIVPDDLRIERDILPYVVAIWEISSTH